jgi:hypothetical protein
MKISWLKEIIKDYADDDVIFVAFYEKSEIDEYVQENICDSDCDGTCNANVTNEEWQKIVERMEEDEDVFTELGKAFDYYRQQMFENRTKQLKGDK